MATSALRAPPRPRNSVCLTYSTVYGSKSAPCTQSRPFSSSLVLMEPLPIGCPSHCSTSMSPSPDFRYLVGIMFLRTPGGWFVGNHANVKIKGFSLELGLESPGYKECTVEACLAIQTQSFPFVPTTQSNYSLKPIEMCYNHSFDDDVFAYPFSLEEPAERAFILGLMRYGRYRLCPEGVPLWLDFQRAAVQCSSSRRRFPSTFESCSPSQ